MTITSVLRLSTSVVDTSLEQGGPQISRTVGNTGHVFTFSKRNEVIIQDLLKDFFASSPESILPQVVRRKRNRSFDLVCIEEHPGPTIVEMNTVGRKSRAEIRSNQLIPASQSRNQMMMPKSSKKKNNRRRNRGLRSQFANQFDVNSGVARDRGLYLKCLNNPFDEIPVRLGGETMQPSGIATLTQRVQLTTGAGGNLSLVLYPFGTQSVMQSTTASTPYTYTVLSPGFPGGSSLAAIATGGRIVAAGVRVFTTQNANADNGLVTIGCLPRDTVNSSGTLSIGGYPIGAGTTATQGFNEFNNYLSTESYPLRCGASAVYRPEDPLDFTFRFLPVAGSGIPGTADLPLSPFFVVGISGAASSSATIFLEYVVHIEYTVNEGTAGVVDTGMGDMTSVDSFKTAKQLMGGLVDTTFQGVNGGLKRLAGAAISAGLQYVREASGRAYGSTSINN